MDDLAELASLIHAARMQEENIQTISAMVEQYRARERSVQFQLEQILAEQARTAKGALADGQEEEWVKLVEDALRRMHDISYLSEHPLSRLRAVELERQKQKDPSSSIARGKALHQILLRTLEQLRPDGAEPNPSQIPPRGWHPFLILRDSYVDDQPNRNTMSRLYIGEGTFNRTRRRAIRNVARALQEIEAKA